MCGGGGTTGGYDGDVIIPGDCNGDMNSSALGLYNGRSVRQEKLFHYNHAPKHSTK